MSQLKGPRWRELCPESQVWLPGSESQVLGLTFPVCQRFVERSSVLQLENHLIYKTLKLIKFIKLYNFNSMKLWNFNWFCKIHGKNQNLPKFCFNKFLCRIRFFAVSIVKALVPTVPMFLPLKCSFLQTLYKNPPRAIIVLKVELAERGTRWTIFICLPSFQVLGESCFEALYAP